MAKVVEEVEDVPKSKAEMRDVEHEFENDGGDWCKVCGRSEGWTAHGVKDAVPVEVIQKVQTPPVPDEGEEKPKGKKGKAESKP